MLFSTLQNYKKSGRYTNFFTEINLFNILSTIIRVKIVVEHFSKNLTFSAIKPPGAAFISCERRPATFIIHNYLPNFYYCLWLTSLLHIPLQKNQKAPVSIPGLNRPPSTSSSSLPVATPTSRACALPIPWWWSTKPPAIRPYDGPKEISVKKRSESRFLTLKFYWDYMTLIC